MKAAGVRSTHSAALLGVGIASTLLSTSTIGNCEAW